MADAENRHFHQPRAQFTPSSSRLLVAGDPPPFAVLHAGAGSPYLIVCDHAGREVPKALGDLGLQSAHFDAHIAWDIGARALAEDMARRLAAPLIRQTYSRLVIDCNRDPDRPDAVVKVSDGVAIAGNRELDAAGLAARVADIHAPYHNRIAAELDVRAALGLTTAVLAVHSFTPVMNGQARPWHVGVLHLGGSPLSTRALAALRARPDLIVGDNQPYTMDGTDHTIPRHAIGRGLDYLELEIRQDLIADAAGVERFGEMLATMLTQLAL